MGRSINWNDIRNRLNQLYYKKDLILSHIIKGKIITIKPNTQYTKRTVIFVYSEGTERDYDTKNNPTKRST